MHPAQVKNCAEALDEAANVLEQLALKHPKIFDELQVRYPLADELGGFAGMLREHSQSLEQQAVQQTTEVIQKARGQAANGSAG
ncbi:hypothetical protein AB4Y45_32580 [Paraburkholderia sp. EG287A]|uniref:hypothetical protein n=1 Tax=Paraburkholderia sp. EG287A TaxID=3237012 RepID=UPI0034D178E7